MKTEQEAHDPATPAPKAKSKENPKSKIHGIPQGILTSGFWILQFSAKDTPTHLPGGLYLSKGSAPKTTPQENDGIQTDKLHRREYKLSQHPSLNHPLVGSLSSLSTLQDIRHDPVLFFLSLPLTLSKHGIIQEKIEFSWTGLHNPRQRPVDFRNPSISNRIDSHQLKNRTDFAAGGGLRCETTLDRDTIDSTDTCTTKSSPHRFRGRQLRQWEQLRTRWEPVDVGTGGVAKQPQETSRMQGRLRSDLTQTRARRLDYRQPDTPSMTDETFLACFGPDDDMDTEIRTETPTESLKKLLAAKTKEKPNSKRPRDKNTPAAAIPKCTPETIHNADLAKHTHRSLWFGFEAMEKLAEENGQDPLFYEETIADRVTRGISRVEATELEQVSISYPRIPQLLYPNKRTDGLPGQHYNLTQVPSEIPTDPSTCLSLDFQI